jgi:ribosome-associated translation inhibitor RaiA
MTRDAKVIVHFGDVEHTDELAAALEKRCLHLASEFSEAGQFEISLSTDRNDVSAHAKVTGKNTSVAAHANAPDARQAADAALDRLERELRNRHDKRIFTLRRAARREKASKRG